MTNVFHAPVSSFQPCAKETMDAIETLMSLSLSTRCLRLDLFVTDDTFQLLIMDDVNYLALGDDQSAHFLSLKDLDGEVRSAYLEVLARLNEDPHIPGNVSHHFMSLPLSQKMEKRHLSVLFFGKGLGAVVQEYIPDWIDGSPEKSYFEADEDPQIRAEIMSIFYGEDLSNHQRLDLENHAKACHPLMAAMFELHSDNEEFATLAPIDFTDRLDT
jgi:hypothetical protein